MARPRKEGMEYFPHDTDARNDMKIRKLRAVFGNDGYTTYFILLENIYRNKDYCIDISDAETKLILSEECRISEDKFTEIILKCIDLDLFSKEEYETNKILTSEAIKKRTEPVENKRKKNKNDYNSKKEEVSDAETIAEINVSEAETMSESTQRKEKNSKEKNNIYNAQIDDLWSMYPNKKGKAVAVKKIPKLIKEIGYEELQRCIERYSKEVKGKEIEFMKHGSTFFNGGYVDYLDKNYKEIVDIPKVEVINRPNAGAYRYI